MKSPNPSGNSANTTILEVVGVEVAVNVSDINHILVAHAPASKTKRIPPSPPAVPGPSEPSP